MGYVNISGQNPAGSNFIVRGLELLRRLEYRPMHNPADLEELFRFRYNCYHGKGYIEPTADKMSYDSLDDDPHVMRFGVYMDEQLVSSIRLQHLTREKRLGPSMIIYPDIVEPMIDQGLTMIDPSRLTVDKAVSDEYPLLPYLTVRLAAMASIHFNVDYCLSSIRPSHGPFYRRVIESKLIHGERFYPGMDFPVHLYASDVQASKGRVFRRYAFFNSLPMEREMLFGEPATDRAPPLTILPTADYSEEVKLAISA